MTRARATSASRMRDRSRCQCSSRGTGTGAQAGQAGAHLVRRVRDGRVQHGVSCGVAQCEEAGEGGHELFGADAGEHGVGRHRDAEAAVDPCGSCLPVRRARRLRRGIRSRRPPRLRVRSAPLRASGRPGCRPSSRRCRRARRRPRRGAPQAVVRVRRRDEPGLGHWSILWAPSQAPALRRRSAKPPPSRATRARSATRSAKPPSSRASRARSAIRWLRSRLCRSAPRTRESG